MYLGATPFLHCQSLPYHEFHWLILFLSSNHLCKGLCNYSRYPRVTGVVSTSQNPKVDTYHLQIIFCSLAIKIRVLSLHFYSFFHCYSVCDWVRAKRLRRLLQIEFNCVILEDTHEKPERCIKLKTKLRHFY